MSTRQRRGESGRAAFFVVAGLVALLSAIPFSMWLSTAPGDQSTYERLGGEIGCTCGTCPHRPIDTCGCPIADEMLAHLQGEIDQGKSDEEIMATFIAQYGSNVRIKPRGTGIDLMAWLAPMALLLVGAVTVSAVIAHWYGQRPTPAVEAAPDPASAANPSGAGQTDRYRDIVERELDALSD